MPASQDPGQPKPANSITANTSERPFSQTAAIPANDDFDTPIVISGMPYTNTQDVSEATTAADDPTNNCQGAGYHTVWYRYTPPLSGTLLLDTSGSTFDPRLAVWTGSRGHLVSVACYFPLQVAVTAGTTYYIEAESLYYNDSAHSLTLHANLTHPPANDDIGLAIVIGGLPYNHTQDVSGATTATDDPRYGSNGYQYNRTVWYRYTPALSGTYLVDPGGSNYNTILGVWTGSRGSLVTVKSQTNPSSMAVDLTAGTAYYIEAAAESTSDSAPSLTLSVSLVPPPANDDFNSPIVISGSLPYTHTQDVRGATTATDDPPLACYNSLAPKLYWTLWYRYTPGVSGTLLLDNIGSNYVGLLAVWTGSRGSLVPVKCERFAYYSNSTYLQAAVTAGTTYFIEVAAESTGYPSSPSLTLNASWVPTPSNDDFNSPIVISALPYTHTQDVNGATTATDDPSLNCNVDKSCYRTVWYRFTPSVSSTYLVDVSGSNYPVELAVWTGSRGSLTSVGSPTTSTQYLNLTAGTAYQIEAVALYPYGIGTPSFTMALSAVPPPANDDFDSPIVIGALPYTHTQDVKGATTATDDPAFGCAGGKQNSLSVWYRYTPTVSGTLLLDNSGSDYYRALAVWTGSRGSLVSVGCSSTDASSNLVVGVTAGTAYYIEAVATWSATTTTSLTLNASFVLPPSNDDFNSPLVISGLPYTHSQDVTGATTATDDPYISPTNTDTGKYYRTVWYRYTPSASGTYLFDASGSNYAKMLAVWSGNRGNLAIVYNSKNYSSTLQVLLTAGTTYSIEVAAFTATDPAPSLTLAASFVPPPANDDFNAPIVVSGTLPYTHTQDVSGATIATDDPSVYGAGLTYRTVWYRYTPAANGTLTLDAWGSSYETVLSVFTGSRGSLTTVGWGLFTVQVLVSAGTTYSIMVAADRPTDQSPTLALSLDVVPTPANDDFSSPIEIGPMPYTHTQDVNAATTAADDPNISCAGGKKYYRSVWYRYTPSQSGTLTLDTWGSTYDTVLAVWTGSRGSLVSQGCGNMYSGSTAQVAVTGGTTYYIEIAKFFSI